MRDGDHDCPDGHEIKPTRPAQPGNERSEQGEDIGRNKYEFKRVDDAPPEAGVALTRLLISMTSVR